MGCGIFLLLSPLLQLGVVLFMFCFQREKCACSVLRSGTHTDTGRQVVPLMKLQPWDTRETTVSVLLCWYRSILIPSLVSIFWYLYQYIFVPQLLVTFSLIPNCSSSQALLGKFHKNLLNSFWVIRQTRRQINVGEAITSVVEVNKSRSNSRRSALWLFVSWCLDALQSLLIHRSLTADCSLMFYTMNYTKRKV